MLSYKDRQFKHHIRSVARFCAGTGHADLPVYGAYLRTMYILQIPVCLKKVSETIVYMSV